MKFARSLTDTQQSSATILPMATKQAQLEHGVVLLRCYFSEPLTPSQTLALLGERNARRLHEYSARICCFVFLEASLYYQSEG